MAKISINNGFNTIDCDDLSEEQAEKAEEYILNDAKWSEEVAYIMVEIQGHEPTTHEFVRSFCEEYTRRFNETYSLP